ncbi:hypothetical protein HDU93_010057 [Gonapodya sp. JEL0774]|nr:hypothetical protein HDU93_010057 [Gonapodya sp. JEL0774]
MSDEIPQECLETSRKKATRAGGPSKTKRHRCTYPDCVKEFSTGGHLTRHVKTFHSHERPFACGIGDCAARFSRHDNCRQHRKIHFRTADSGEVYAASSPRRSLKKEDLDHHQIVAIDESPKRISLRARTNRPKYVQDSCSEVDEEDDGISSDALSEDTVVDSAQSSTSPSGSASPRTPRFEESGKVESPTITVREVASPTLAPASGSPAPSDGSHKTALYTTAADEKDNVNALSVQSFLESEATLNVNSEASAPVDQQALYSDLLANAGTLTTIAEQAQAFTILSPQVNHHLHHLPQHQPVFQWTNMSNLVPEASYDPALISPQSLQFQLVQLPNMAQALPLGYGYPPIGYPTSAGHLDAIFPPYGSMPNQYLPVFTPSISIPVSSHLQTVQTPSPISQYSPVEMPVPFPQQHQHQYQHEHQFHPQPHSTAFKTWPFRTVEPVAYLGVGAGSDGVDSLTVFEEWR